MEGFMSIYILMMHLYAWGITDVNMFSVVAARCSSSRTAGGGGVVLLDLYRQQHVGGSGVAVVGPVVDVHGVAVALRLLCARACTSLHWHLSVP